MSCNPTESRSAPPMLVANPCSPPPPPQMTLEKEFLHHMDMAKEPAPCCDLCYTRLGLARQSIPSATNATVPRSPLRNLYLLPSQLRNKPKVESTTLGFSCPFQGCWKYWHNSASEQMWRGLEISVENIQENTFTCKAPVGQREGWGGKRKKKAKQPWAMTLTQRHFSRSEEIFGCATPAKAGNMGLGFFVKPTK